MINQILSHTSDSLFALNPHGLQPPLLFTICVPPQPHSCDSGGVTTAPEQTRGLLTESFTSSTESTSEKVRAGLYGAALATQGWCLFDSIYITL